MSSRSLDELIAGVAPLSPGLAERARQAAPIVDEALGPSGMATWVAALDLALRLDGPSREASIALLDLDRDALADLGAPLLEAWTIAGRSLGAVAARPAASLLAALLRGVRQVPVAQRGARVESAEAAVRSLASRHGSDGHVQRFAAAAGLAVASHGPEALFAWAELCSLTSFGRRRSTVLVDALPGTAGLDDASTVAMLRIAGRAARSDADLAARIARLGAAALVALPQTDRAVAVDLFARLPGSPEILVEALELAGPVLRRFAPSARPRILGHGRAIAQAVPEAAAHFLRRVPRVAEHLGVDADLDAFVAKGLALAAEHPDAGIAFFALESRSARSFLGRHDVAVVFDDVEATLRGYLQLVDGRRLTPIAVDAPGLFPRLELDGASIPIARSANVFPAWEDNFALVKLQATLGALELRTGTFQFDLPKWLARFEPGGPTETTSDEGLAGLRGLFARFRDPELAAGFFAHLEAVRLAPLVARAYPGLAADVQPLRERLFSSHRPLPEQGPSGVILFLALGGAADDVDWGAADGAWGPALHALARAAATRIATVDDTAGALAEICDRVAAGEMLRIYGVEDLLGDELEYFHLLDPDEDDRPARYEPNRADTERVVLEDPEKGDGERSEERGDAGSVDPELLRAYLEQRPTLKVRRADGTLDPVGLFVTGLKGGGDGTTERDRERSGASPGSERALALQRHGHRTLGTYLVDEWDHRIHDYRVAWCRVHELTLDGDSGEFFASTLHRFADVLPEVRRQFQRVKPEGYRTIHGLLDGEDFDLNATVMARADLRARRTPSPKLYTARQREERDVATAFLLDMSASTDEQTGDESRRIIDIQKDALVIMAQALDEIGDQFSIYGFSGHGRDCVEVYAVKSFDEALTHAVRGRIGAIEPQRSTRMGAALRQVIAKLQAMPSRAKHLFLLSDGFPQDFDYGDDRRSNVYGLRDTMMALREAQRAGIATFCITVDRAGHDYLREMCESSRYLVIDDIASLPAQLPKLYSEATHAGR